MSFEVGDWVELLTIHTEDDDFKVGRFYRVVEKNGYGDVIENPETGAIVIVQSNQVTKARELKAYERVSWLESMVDRLSQEGDRLKEELDDLKSLHSELEKEYEELRTSESKVYKVTLKERSLIGHNTILLEATNFISDIVTKDVLFRNDRAEIVAMFKSQDIESIVQVRNLKEND